MQFVDNSADAAERISCVIASTVRFPPWGASVVLSFVGYHLAIGFSHILLFFDDIEDKAIDLVLESFSSTQVTVIKKDDALLDSWKSCPSYPVLKDIVASKVHARQRLNCEIALKLALDRGDNWLVHLDSDELFHTSAGCVEQHFRELNRRNILQMTYLNHEGVPEGEPGAGGIDYFAETTLFRRHHTIVSMSHEARECMKVWQQRRTHGQYFLAYDIGKTAVRVLPGVFTESVHKFTLPKIPDGKKSCTAIIDPRNFDMSRYCQMEDPCILHYVVCGLPWYRSKYDMLGQFSNAWYDGKVPIAPSFHLDSRDLIRGSDDLNIQKFYQQQVMLNMAPPELDKMISSGVCIRIEKPSQILQKMAPKKRMYSSPLPPVQSATAKGGEGGSPSSTVAGVDSDSVAASAKKELQKMFSKNCKEREGGPGLTYDKAWMIASSVKKFL